MLAADVARSVRASANRAHRGRYRGQWDGPEWVVVRICQRIRTTRGLAFVAGDLTLAKPLGPGSWSAYSILRQSDTRLEARNVEVFA